MRSTLGGLSTDNYWTWSYRVIIRVAVGKKLRIHIHNSRILRTYPLIYPYPYTLRGDVVPVDQEVHKPHKPNMKRKASEDRQLEMSTREEQQFAQWMSDYTRSRHSMFLWKTRQLHSKCKYLVGNSFSWISKYIKYNISNVPQFVTVRSQLFSRPINNLLACMRRKVSLFLRKLITKIAIL